jgi:hypothetical protein
MFAESLYPLQATVSICKVGDCGLQTYQIVTILKRATALDFTTISPILYIHCCKLAVTVVWDFGQIHRLSYYYKSKVIKSQSSFCQ